MAQQPYTRNNQERFGRGQERQAAKDDIEKLDTSDINLKTVDAELFSNIAKKESRSDREKYEK